MKHIKSVTDIFIILFALLIFMQWYRSENDNTVQNTSALLKYYKVYLITVDKRPYWLDINQGASDMAAALGIQYQWVAPDTKSVSKQIELIKEAVDNGAKALLIAADDPKNISGVVEDAKARGVRIIYVDSPAYEEATITLSSDNYKAGVAAGQAMLSELKKQGITSGSIGIVSVEAKKNTELRESGFRKVIQEDATFTLLDTKYTNGAPDTAKEAARIMIQNNRDLVALLGTSQGTGEGVGNAITEYNSKIIGVGFDKTEEMQQLLNDGSLKALVVQNPYTMGYLGMAEAVAAIMGNDTGPSYINTGISVMKKD